MAPREIEQSLQKFGRKVDAARKETLKAAAKTVWDLASPTAVTTRPPRGRLSRRDCPAARLRDEPPYTSMLSEGRSVSSSLRTTWSLVTPAASALKVVMTRWRRTGRATAATSAVVAW